MDAPPTRWKWLAGLLLFEGKIVTKIIMVFREI